MNMGASARAALKDVLNNQTGQSVIPHPQSEICLELPLETFPSLP